MRGVPRLRFHTEHDTSRANVRDVSTMFIKLPLVFLVLCKDKSKIIATDNISIVKALRQ
jgi:hypothetical protein